MIITAYFLTFIEGILTFISPCILPMLPLYFFYLAGSKGSKNNTVINSSGFIIGFTITFIILGTGASMFSHFLIANKDIFRIISGLVIIVFGFNFLGLLKLKILNMEKRMEFSASNMNFIKAIVFGIVFAFGWSPCIGSFLGGAIVLAGNSKTMYEGILLLLVYSAGLAIPFFITSLIYENIKASLIALQKHSQKISIVSGIILILEGLLILTDGIKYINYLVG